MNLTTISEISREMNISTRTLRYYEQIGLIQSIKKDGYAYRTYDEDTVNRLHQILVLRKLRIPLKQIDLILQNENMAEIIETFQQNLNEVDDEITALSTVRDIINTFITWLNESIHQDIKLNILDDTALLEALDALTVSKVALKEEKTAADLERASEKLSKLTDKDVRIVYLPPATVASIHIICGRAPETGNGELSFYPEGKTGELMSKFIKTVSLPAIKPDFRHYGFNHPNGSNDGGPSDDHGYERWVTIPDELEVKPPFTKKRFEGGLYAAHMIPIGAFEEWGWLWRWVNESRQFDFNRGDHECMDGLLEEHLNAYNHYKLQSFDESKIQLDLLMPIKEYNN